MTYINCVDGTRIYDESISDVDLINDAYKLWLDIESFESNAREQMKDDARFINGEVYSTGFYNERKLTDRPALNVPRINQFTNFLKNGMRQSKPSIKTYPRSAENPEIEKQRIKIAENRQGLIRALQYDSQSTDAYQAAFDSAIDVGRGFVRVLTQYVSDKSFDQEIKIELVPEPFDVYMSRHRKMPDYSDAKYGFILSTVSKDSFGVMYPDASPGHWGNDSESKWLSSDDVTIVEFYCTWIKKRTLFQLPDGQKGYLDELGKLPNESRYEVEQLLKHPESMKREVSEPYIMYYKMTHLEILERKPVLGKYIPIVPMIGYETRVNGQLNIKGIVRDLKDVAKMYNYAASTEAERLTYSPKIRFIIAEGQIETHESEWGNANDSSQTVLSYKPTSNAGHPVPPPQQIAPMQIDGALIQAKAGYVDDMRAISGISAPALGMMAPQRSGIAIKELKMGTDIVNLHYTDNARICIAHVGRIVNEWLPSVYDTPRSLKILGMELEEKTINLHQRDNDGDLVELGDDDYDVVTTMGSDVLTKRQESLDFMMELVRVAPQITPLIYDLLVKNIDAPGSQEIAERLKKTIPPQILAEEGGEAKLRNKLQQAMQQLQQDKMAIMQLSKQLEHAMLELQNNDADRANDIEVENIKNQGKIAVAEINAMAKREADATKRAQAWYKIFNDYEKESNNGEENIQFNNQKDILLQ